MKPLVLANATAFFCLHLLWFTATVGLLYAYAEEHSGRTIDHLPGYFVFIN